MTVTINSSDPSTWDPDLDAVVAAPKHHRVIFENDCLRVLDVTLERTTKNRSTITGGRQSLCWTGSSLPSSTSRRTESDCRRTPT